MDNSNMWIKHKNNRSIKEQVDILVKLTETHKKCIGLPKSKREVEFLKILYPASIRNLEIGDKFIGKTDYSAVGFGCVTSTSGVGYFFHKHKIDELKNNTKDKELLEKINLVEKYWCDKDTQENFRKELKKSNPEFFKKFAKNDNYSCVVCGFSRLSGMQLNYNKLLDLGVNGLKKSILSRNKDGKNDFYRASLEALDLFLDIANHFEIETRKLAQSLIGDKLEREEVLKVSNCLKEIKKGEKPKSFREAIQLTWLYGVVAGVVNYGRMDDYLGEYLLDDLNNDKLTEKEALDLVKSFWKMIAWRKTVMNGRVTIGGKGRRNEKAADKFAMIAMEATRINKDLEPQLTLRIYEKQNKKLLEKGLEVISEGCTFPMIYNDEVNIPSLASAMNVSLKEAEDYVPFGCGEIILCGKSVGTPNVLINTLKALEVTLRNGYDRVNDVSLGYNTGKIEDFDTFDKLLEAYKTQLKIHIEELAKAQRLSYDVMKENCSFIYVSLLIDDCIEKGKELLSGGARHLGGTLEVYGNINSANSLTAIKKIVFEDKKINLKQLVHILDRNFNGFEEIRNELLNAPKYGNDEAEGDLMASKLHEYVCMCIKESAKDIGLDSFLAVVINNHSNTIWGRTTLASADGRKEGQFMANGNNPYNGTDINGPTAMLNSLTKLKTDIHAGSVQNMKFSRSMFKNHINIINQLLEVYFENGGSQIMITVVDSKELEKAYNNPTNYRNLIVRVGGFSARFVELDRQVQKEVMERTLYE